MNRKQEVDDAWMMKSDAMNMIAASIEAKTRRKMGAEVLVWTGGIAGSTGQARKPTKSC